MFILHVILNRLQHGIPTTRIISNCISRSSLKYSNPQKEKQEKSEKQMTNNAHAAFVHLRQNACNTRINWVAKMPEKSLFVVIEPIALSHHMFHQLFLTNIFYHIFSRFRMMKKRKFCGDIFFCGCQTWKKLLSKWIRRWHKKGRESDGKEQARARAIRKTWCQVSHLCRWNQIDLLYAQFDVIIL